MKKIIKIDGKEYTIKSSAFTQFKYKDTTGRDLLDDLTSIEKKLDGKSEKEMTAELGDMLEIIFKVIYVLIDEAGVDNVGSYEDFLKGIDNVLEDTTYINESLEVALAPLSRGIKTTSPDKQ